MPLIYIKSEEKIVIILIFFLKSFGGSENSRTFASAFREQRS